MIELTLNQALQHAIVHHRAGRLQEAERLYRAILETQPNHPDANHNLGVLVVQLGKPAAALPWLKTALDGNSRQGQYWLSYIDALIQSDQTDAARQVLEQGRQRGLQGEAVDALAGRIDQLENPTPDCSTELACAIAHREVGRYKEAALVLQSWLVGNPQDASAYALLAQVLSLDKQEEPAWVALNIALSINPALPIVQRNHARLLLKQQKLDEALQAAQTAYQSEATDPENQLVLAAVLGANNQNEQASPLIESALQSRPNYAEAYANRALLKLRGNDLAGAQADAEKSLSIKPHLGQLWGMVSSLRHQLKNLPGAIDALEKALDYEPDKVGHLVNLGEFKREAGAVEAAIALLEKAISIAPENAGAWVNLGTALQESKRIHEAKAAYAKALEIAPEQAEVASNLGALAKEEGNWEEALRYFNQALVYQPTRVAIMTNRAGALNALERYDEAEQAARHAIEVEPAHTEAHNNLGNALQKLGRFSDSEASYRRALEIKPDFAEVHSNLGAILKDLGRLDEAEASHRRALQIKPDFAEAHSNLGNTLQDMGRLNEAEASYRRALQIKPDYVEAHNNLGNTLKDLGRSNEAEVCYRRAMEFKPDYEDAFGGLLFTLNYHPDRSGEEIFSVYREYDNRFCLPHYSSWRPHGNSREMKRRLKVGYVSPDFYYHSVGHFLEPLLSRHDKRMVEIYAYSERAREDAVTARYKTYVDHWIPTLGMPDALLAERIRDDGIDILVDLAGHTAHNRLQVFARKPAPVSVTWLGYGYTTGLTGIDYILTDAASTPLGSEALFSEQPWRLETPNYAYRPAEGMGTVGSLPATKRGVVTFGTLTRSVRINHRTIRVWSEILKQVDGALLVMDSKSFQDDGLRRALLEQFAAYGIDSQRLVMGCHSPPWDVLRGLDIGLDCFPHNSGTTLFETLYMGVPIVTLAGRPSVGRLGSSILEGLGRSEWIARTEEEYIQKAVALASDLPALACLRARLRAEMQASPLMDEPAFARKVEAAYREMFAKWCENNP